jgi:hypothetical protein
MIVFDTMKVDGVYEQGDKDYNALETLKHQRIIQQRKEEKRKEIEEMKKCL